MSILKDICIQFLINIFNSTMKNKVCKLFQCTPLSLILYSNRVHGPLTELIIQAPKTLVIVPYAFSHSKRQVTYT